MSTDIQYIRQWLLSSMVDWTALITAVLLAFLPAD